VRAHELHFALRPVYRKRRTVDAAFAGGLFLSPMTEISHLRHERGGSGSRAILLLHGLGATAAVWHGLQKRLESKQVQWIAPDLSGHGHSPWRSHYSIGQLATDVAPLVQDAAELYIVGHSLGAYVGLALASRWFGVRVAGVLGVGPKITWSDADLQGTRELAARPVRWYAQEAEAIARYRRVSGLDERTAPDTDFIARGVHRSEEGFRLAQDPRTFMVGGAPFGTLVTSAACTVRLARGESDAMVSLEELRSHEPRAVSIAGAGHNVHAEDPAAVVHLLDQLMDHA
jgi:pimeloyl-ACP methyl ester carboxylesterase